MNIDFNASWFHHLCLTVGEDPEREGLADTPRRIASAWQDLLVGYSQSAEEVLSTFFESEGHNGLVILRDVEFFSTCEHHLLPFFGKAHVGYIPDKRIVGISKLARAVDLFARRLQNQERLTDQIADAVDTVLHPKGVAVVIEASHLCMRARGVEKQNSEMVTSALRGCLMESEGRGEFMSLVRGAK
jgi:GTP cyclohydrolase IA